MGLGDDLLLPLGEEASIPATLDDGRLGEVAHFPIYVTCGPTELDGLIGRVPAAKRDDLVFIHAGDMLEPILKRRALYYNQHSQVTAYFGVNAFDVPVDGLVDLGAAADGSAKVRGQGRCG
jgi:hypothetical protein